MNKYLLALLCLLFGSIVSIAQPPVEKITLTGTLNEPAVLCYGDKRVEVKYLPYEFSLMQEDIPLTITIESANYEYRSIYIRKYEKADYKIAKQAKEPIPRTYLVVSEKKAQPNVDIELLRLLVEQKTMTEQTELSKNEEEQKKKETTTISSEVDNAPTVPNLVNEKTFALIIANEHYQQVAPVEMAENDGRVFMAYCNKTLGIPENNIKYYPDATYGNMSRALRTVEDIADAFKGDINLIVFYAGHGIPDNETKNAFLLPVDADGLDMRDCFSLNNLYAQLDALQLNSTVIFLDACFSGAQRGGDMIVEARGVAVRPKEGMPLGNTVVFSATSDVEAAYPYREKGHGLFTYFLLKKLQETKGKVSLGELAEYLKTNVSQKAIVVNGRKQTPTITPSPSVRDSWMALPLIGEE